MAPSILASASLILRTSDPQDGKRLMQKMENETDISPQAARMNHTNQLSPYSILVPAKRNVMQPNIINRNDRKAITCQNPEP